MIKDCHTLSPHEQRIHEEMQGKEFFEGRERVFKILNSFKNKKPVIDVERAKYFTESFKQTEGQPLVLRWAKALKNIAENITVYIDEDQLIVGRSGADKGRYGILFPELDGDFLDLAIEQLPKRVESSCDITPEGAKIIIEEISPYWKGKTYHEALAAALPEETLKLTYDPNDLLRSRFIVNETSSFRSSIQWVADFEKGIKRGFKDIKQEALDKIAELDPFSPFDNVEKRPYLDAIVITCDALILWAKRHSKMAAEMAAKEADPVKKKELEQIAEICNWVPENPARNFREAMQSQWFMQMFSRIEQKTGTLISNGRMDQYLYPYYKQDIEQGKITDDDVIELLECMWLAMAQFIDMYISPTGGAFNEGYAHWEAVTIGGQTPDGRDATNELTYLFLKSKREFPIHYPDLAARIHARAPEKFLHEVAETIKEGSGFPKLINDEEVVPLLLSKGATFDEAMDYAVSGCSEARMVNRDTYTSGGAYINFASAIEMTMYNGRTKATGDDPISIKTGDPRNFKTWDEFYNAYIAQQTNFIKHAFIQQRIIDGLRPQHFAVPLLSSLHDLCMKNCKDLHSREIEGGINMGYFEFLGFGTVIDSLAAIKKLVFEDKKLSMSDLIAALEVNFEGKEAIRQMLINAPKYGNNDPYADELGYAVDRAAVEFAKRYALKELGVNLDLRLVPFTSHVPFGKVVSATPDGRKATMPLADGASASPGADAKGPTAVLLSNFNTKSYDYKNRASRLVNIKFNPSTVAGELGTKKLISFIKTWSSLKLWHVQFNIINRDTLLAAKKDPDKYRGLIVRIAGYSSYFVDLSPDLQDNLIARTEHTSM